MDKIQRSLSTLEDLAYLRTKEGFEEDIHLHDLSQTGIKEECIFHRLPGFHVIDNLSADIMHDILEGICKFDIVSLIKNYTSKVKLFSLLELNDRLQKHDWGVAESGNIPLPILEKDLSKDDIRMSASEMITFVRHFGIFVGDCVSEDDPAWQIYLNLRQILALVTSSSVQAQCCVLLKYLIKDHNLLVRKLLSRNLKPKDHFLTHLPRIMSECGPLINLWCMRFESQHRESKLSASVSNSTQNVCETIAKRQQLNLACTFYH